MDILNCINHITHNEFTLSDVYEYIGILSEIHPQNNNIEAKIRQQLQLLRDRGVIEFLGKGRYRKIW